MAGVHAPAFVPGAVAATQMQVTTVFSCGHRYLNYVDISLDQSEIEMKVGACNKDECQARPLADVLGQRVTLDKQVKNFIKHMEQTLFTAGMQAEGALRVLSNAEPMLPMEMEAVSATPDMVQAFLGCLNPTRTVAAAMYTGHRGALAMLHQYRLCFQTGTSQWQADELMHALCTKNNTIQQKLGALVNVQSTLCANSWEAPLAHFTGAYSLATVDPYWGEQQLQALRDSNGGKAILALPLTRENILTAKKHIQDWKTQFISFFAQERAAYYRDYPGVEQLRAAGKLKTTEQILAEIGDDSNMVNHFTGFMIKPQHNRNCDDGVSPVFIGVDGGLEHNKTGAFVRSPGGDIRALRTERIGCKAMARNTLTIDLAKALKCPKSD